MRAWLTECKSNPVQFIEGAFSPAINLEPWQREALNLLTSHDRVAIKSGHGVGKSALEALAIIWFLLTRYPAKVPCTAPTAHQLNDVLWAELAQWYRRLKEPFKSWLTLKSDRIELADAGNEHFAVARTARKEQPEAFQGFHAEHLLFVVDEASGVEDIIFEVAQGALSTQGAKVLMAGNPTRLSGYFHEAFHRLRERWATMTVSSETVPRARGHIEDIIARYGKDSNAYKVRVLGEFPTTEDDSVISLGLVEAALTRKIEPIKTFSPVWGLDVARFGDDRTALAKRQCNRLLEPIQFKRQFDLMQTAGWVKSQWDETPYDERPGEILVDSIGIGAGVVDRLRELGLPVRGINVGESASSNDRYMRLRDELWFKGREWFDAKDCIIPDDPALIAELTGAKYSFTSSGKILVESKDEMKKRGLASPDLADAFLLTLAGGYHKAAAVDKYRAYSRKNKQPQGRSWQAA